MTNAGDIDLPVTLRKSDGYVLLSAQQSAPAVAASLGTSSLETPHLLRPDATHVASGCRFAFSLKMSEHKSNHLSK